MMRLSRLAYEDSTGLVDQALHVVRAMEARKVANGRLAEARQEAASAAQVTNYFVPISLPLAARAALWAGDVADANAVIEQIDASVMRGQAIGLDLVTLRAGIAALEGRRADAIAGYREALRGWRQLGLAFDEAMAALDMAILLAPHEREMAEASTAFEAARVTLTRLEARPLLVRLDQAPAVTTGPAPRAPSASAPASGDARVNI